jgi:3-oxoacyl-[acyl-carrier protein] reductase
MPHHVQSGVYRSAVMAVCKRLSRELAPVGVRVNTVAPASIVTERLRGVLDLEERTKQVPLGRLGAPEDMAAVIAFLASSKASFVTGVNVQVDGGYVTGVQ